MTRQQGITRQGEGEIEGREGNVYELSSRQPSIPPVLVANFYLPNDISAQWPGFPSLHGSRSSGRAKAGRELSRNSCKIDGKLQNPQDSHPRQQWSVWNALAGKTSHRKRNTTTYFDLPHRFLGGYLGSSRPQWWINTHVLRDNIVVFNPHRKL